MNYVNFSAIAGVISPAMAEISDLRQQVKGDSSKCINEKKFIRSKFSWQGNERKENALWAFLAKSQPSGARGAFSYGKSQVHQVIQYIQDQEDSP